MADSDSQQQDHRLDGGNDDSNLEVNQVQRRPPEGLTEEVMNDAFGAQQDRDQTGPDMTYDATRNSDSDDDIDRAPANQDVNVGMVSDGDSNGRDSSQQDQTFDREDLLKTNADDQFKMVHEDSHRNILLSS